MRVLIGAPVRQKPEIFERYLQGLRALTVPEGVEVEHLFVLHNSPHLAELLLTTERYAVHDSDDTYEVSDKTHHWKASNVEQITMIKNSLFRYAKDYDFDYLLLVDSDLVLHPQTLAQLLSQEKDIIANVFWTRWQPDQPPMPNAWDMDGYGFYSDSRDLWKKPGCYQVGMSGACILLSRKLLLSGANYSQIPNLSRMLFPGEDRHFCIRAACAGFQVWLETTYPCYHIYRDSDLAGVPENWDDFKIEEE